MTDTENSQSQPFAEQGAFPAAPDPSAPTVGVQPVFLQKSRITAGLFGIIFGAFGIHRFYLGFVGIGLTQLLLTVLSLGFLAPAIWVWGAVEGILILGKSAGLVVDSNGVPLRD